MIRTDAAKAAFAADFRRRWGVALDPKLIADHEVLTPAHEGDIMAEWGPHALIRYYCPTDPRLSASE